MTLEGGRVRQAFVRVSGFPSGLSGSVCPWSWQVSVRGARSRGSFAVGTPCAVLTAQSESPVVLIEGQHLAPGRHGARDLTERVHTHSPSCFWPVSSELAGRHVASAQVRGPVWGLPWPLAAMPGSAAAAALFPQVPLGPRGGPRPHRWPRSLICHPVYLNTETQEKMKFNYLRTGNPRGREIPCLV